MAPPPESQWPPVEGTRSFQIPETAPAPLQISGYTPDQYLNCKILNGGTLLQP